METYALAELRSAVKPCLGCRFAQTDEDAFLGDRDSEVVIPVPSNDLRILNPCVRCRLDASAIVARGFTSQENLLDGDEGFHGRLRSSTRRSTRTETAMIISSPG